MRSAGTRLLRPLAVRLAQAGLVAVLVGCLGFALMHALPGDQAFRLAAERYGPDMVDAAAAAALREELGLDRPLAAQLLDWLGRVLRLDLGRSLITGDPVAEELSVQLGYSLLLAGTALPLSALIGLPLGVTAGLRAGGWVDRAALGLSVLLRAVPAAARDPGSAGHGAGWHAVGPRCFARGLPRPAADPAGRDRLGQVAGRAGCHGRAAARAPGHRSGVAGRCRAAGESGAPRALGPPSGDAAAGALARPRSHHARVRPGGGGLLAGARPAAPGGGGRGAGPPGGARPR